MSISRKNWSALSSLARRWTMEDEEEVERERRRRVRGSSSTADPDVFDPEHPAHGDTDTGDSHATATSEQSLSSEEQMQLDFVEMLRSRDEKRRLRHVETLRRQKEAVDENDDENGATTPRVELLGDSGEEDASATASPSATTTFSKTAQPEARVTHSPRTSIGSETSLSSKDRQFESRESSSKDRDPAASTNQARKFVSSVSISLDKSPSTSGRTTPMSPHSPAAPLSPREPRSPSRTTSSPVQNGHTHETTVNGSSKFEATPKPAFVRQSSRTISFRLMKKKEEESSPLQRSASVRIATKMFERNTDQNPEEETAPSFQRNSRQRISSRSIQEKMERLAQAAQRSETVRSPDMSQRTLSLMEEVSRKRGLFEQQQEQCITSRQDFKNNKSGLSERISRFVNKTNQTGPSHSSTDLRHVDITSKKTLFEKKVEESGKK